MELCSQGKKLCGSSQQYLWSRKPQQKTDAERRTDGDRTEPEKDTRREAEISRETEIDAETRKTQRGARRRSC